MAGIESVTRRALADAVAGIAAGARGKRRGTGTYVRTDPDGTGWVLMAGASEPSPVNGHMVASSEPGDSVTWELDGTALSVTGNASAPAVGASYVEREVSPVREIADGALAEARRAHDAADAAEADAVRAHEAADDAQESADNAAQSATVANRAANNALTQLSFVEDVAGTLTWIQEHGTFVATTDTTVQDGTVYFELVQGDYVPIVNPTGNPQSQGWYVLDTTQSQTDYIMAHLAVTSAGLWVLPSGLGQAASARYAPGYKMLLASDGAYLYDASGHLVSTYGESITFDSSRPQFIGGESAYIVFYDADADGVPDSINIGGANVSIGGSQLSTVLSDVATASQRAEAAMDICQIAITSTGGTVFKQDRGVSTTLAVTVFTGDGQRITDASALHARFGNGAYLQWKWKDSPEDSFSTLVSTDPRIGAGGFTLTVSPSDISTQAIINCELIF